MRIIASRACTLRWPIAGAGAAHGRTERGAVVLEVRSERGRVGLGEAAPLPGMSRDALADAQRDLVAFAGQVPLAVDGCEQIAAVVARVPSAAARFAVETALLDALARERGVSLAAILVGATPASPAGAARGATALADPAASRPPAGHAGALSPAPLAAVVDTPEQARAAWAAGIRCFKIKLAASDDPARAFRIGSAVPQARLRIDANQSWPRAEVAGRLAQLAGLAIDYVEEPCQDSHLLLGEPLALPIALDEGLASLTAGELDAALASRRLAAVVLKPTLLGGLTAALALAARARAAGVAAVASHGLEGPIGTAACAELALVLGAAQPAVVAAHPALAGWRLAVPQLAAAEVRPAALAGLGLGELDLDDVVRACPPSGPAWSGSTPPAL